MLTHKNAQMQTEYVKIVLWNSEIWGKTVKKSQLFQLIETPPTRWGNELEEKYKQPQSEACVLNIQQYLSGQEHPSHFPAPKDASAMVGVFYSLLILLLGPF